MTIADPPPKIETRADIELAAAAVTRGVMSRPDAAAFIIACFSDPGLDAARGTADVFVNASGRPTLPKSVHRSWLLDA